MKLLIADDSDLIRTRLEMLISEIPGICLVGQTCDMAETIQAVQILTPDVLLLDLQMPGGGGLYVLNRLKTMAAPPFIIVLTGYSYGEYRQKCLDLGAAFFFSKASEIDQLIELLQQLKEKEGDQFSNG